MLQCKIKNLRLIVLSVQRHTMKTIGKITMLYYTVSKRQISDQIKTRLKISKV